MSRPSASCIIACMWIALPCFGTEPIGEPVLSRVREQAESLGIAWPSGATLLPQRGWGGPILRADLVDESGRRQWGFSYEDQPPYGLLSAWDYTQRARQKRVRFFEEEHRKADEDPNYVRRRHYPNPMVEEEATRIFRRRLDGVGMDLEEIERQGHVVSIREFAGNGEWTLRILERHKGAILEFSSVEMNISGEDGSTTDFLRRFPCPPEVLPEKPEEVIGEDVARAAAEAFLLETRGQARLAALPERHAFKAITMTRRQEDGSFGPWPEFEMWRMDPKLVRWTWRVVFSPQADEEGRVQTLPSIVYVDLETGEVISFFN